MTATRILVVEDEALIMMSTLDMLRELGHAAAPARCGEAALALYAKDPAFDVLLTDVNLPDMDGQSLAAELRRRRPGLPIVFATGYRLDVEEGLKTGGPTFVLGKPFRTADLAAALGAVVARNAATAGS